MIMKSISVLLLVLAPTSIHPRVDLPALLVEATIHPRTTLHTPSSLAPRMIRSQLCCRRSSRTPLTPAYCKCQIPHRQARYLNPGRHQMLNTKGRYHWHTWSSSSRNSCQGISFWIINNIEYCRSNQPRRLYSIILRSPAPANSPTRPQMEYRVNHNFIRGTWYNRMRPTSGLRQQRPLVPTSRCMNRPLPMFPVPVANLEHHQSYKRRLLCSTPPLRISPRTK